MLALREKYDESTAFKEKLKQDSDDLERKLDRASALVGGLDGERSRWEVSISTLEGAMTNLVGDYEYPDLYLARHQPRRDQLSQTWGTRGKLVPPRRSGDGPRACQP